MNKPLAGIFVAAVIGALGWKRTLLSLPIVFWAFRKLLMDTWATPYLGWRWFVSDVVVVFLVAAFGGFILAVGGWRIQLICSWRAGLKDRTLQQARSKPR